MTAHSVKIESHWMTLLRHRVKTCELRRDDRDYQTGDTIRFLVEGDRYYSDWYEITHVLKHVSGLIDGYVILSLKHPDANFYQDQARSARDRANRAERSNAALRGQITKLKKRIGGTS